MALTNSFDYRVWDNGTRLTNRVQKVTYPDNTYDEYEYNTNNTIKRVTGSNPTVSYTYDTLHRLTKEVNLALGKTFDYTYDKNGNILSKTTDDVATNYQYDTTVKDRLVAVGNQSIEYDAIGNPTSYLGNALTWTRGRLLNSFTNNSYTYNSAGIRTSKNVNGTLTTFGISGNTILSQVTGDLRVKYFHTADGVQGFQYGDSYTYYYRKNLQGDIIAIVDTSGNVIAKYVYDAWGNHKVYYLHTSTNTFAEADSTSNLQNCKIALFNPFRYRGYYYDNETGLYYLQSRYYDPATGRFLNPDTVDYLDPQSVTGINLYAYCENNPVMYIDPTGHFIFGALIIGGLIGAVIGAGTSAVTQGLANGWDNINVGQVILDGAVGAISGVIGATGIGAVGSVISGATLGFVGSIGSDLISSNGDWTSVNWTKAASMAILGGVMGKFSGPGKQNFSETKKVLESGATKWSKKYLIAAAEASIRPNSGLTVQNMYSNLFKGVIRQAYSFQKAGNLGIFASTFLGNL